MTITFSERAMGQWRALAASEQDAGRRLLQAVQLSPAAGQIVDRTPAGRVIRRVSGPRVHIFYVWYRSTEQIAVIDVLDIVWEPSDADNDTGLR